MTAGPVLVAGDGFVLRPFGAADVPLLARWRRHPEVVAWYGADAPTDEEALAAKYVGNPARAHITHTVAEHGGEPVAFVQWYPCQAPYLAAAGLPADDGAWAVDLHLAPERIGGGLGSRLVRLVAAHLTASGVPRVLIDPEAANARAIRAYEKAGFVRVRDLPACSTRDGARRDNVLLEWRQSAGVEPPSTGTTQPVTYDAAGDSRNAATLPNSAGSP